MCLGPKPNWSQLVLTVNAACAKLPERLPWAEIQCVPGTAVAGTETDIGLKLPVALVPATASSVKSKNRSTPSKAPNPAPETLIEEVGGPAVRDSTTLGLTLNERPLTPVPVWVVTAIGPDEPSGGTFAVISLAETLSKELDAPLKVTFETPVNPDPVIVMLFPIVPAVGLKDEIVGACANAPGAYTANAPTQTKTPHKTAAQRPCQPLIPDP